MSRARDAVRTTAATEARRRASAKALERLEMVLRQDANAAAQLPLAEIARRANVSRTFLYQNAQARSLLSDRPKPDLRARPHTGADEPAIWRERALNAEHELRRVHDEVLTQRRRIGELIGQLRDLEQDLPPDGVQALIGQNHTLRVEVERLRQQSHSLEERLASSRDNNRFLDRRLAALEAQIAEFPTNVSRHR